MKIRLFLTFTGVFLTALFLASCSKQEGSNSLKKASTAPNEFVWNNGAEPETLDPHRMSAHDAAQHAQQLYEGLLTRDRDFVGVIPGLASEWNLSNDGKTYSFKLRPDLKWSNGDALTMAQVRDSFFRSMEPEVANPYVYWFTDYIVGAKEYVEALGAGELSPEKKAQLQSKVGINLTSPDSLEIKLKKPAAHFKYFLSQPPFFVVHPSMYDPDATAWRDPKNFVSNGAYNLDEWSVNKRIVMTKNPLYHDAKTASIERLVAYPIVDQSVTYNMYNSGDLDWSGENSISPTLVASLTGREDFHNMPILGTYMYIFNTKKKPFDDVRVRKALSLVIEPEHITDRVLRAGMIPTNKVVPPVIPNYTSLIPPMEASIEERVAEAKKLLAEAGYPDGKGFPSVSIRYNTNESHHKIAQAIQQMWKNRLGLDIKLENMEWKVYLKEQQEGNYDISRYGWIGDYPDPSTFLEIFMTGNDNNRTGWSNKDFDQLVLSSMAIADDKKRFDLQSKAEKMVYDDYPFFGVYHYNYYSLMRPNIEGWEPNMFGHYSMKYLKKN